VGIIQIFHQVMNHHRIRARLGRINEPSKTNRVNFFTPGSLISLKRTNRAFFDQLMRRSGLLLLDEAHHFPDEDKGELKIFGQMGRIAKEHFLSCGKKVVAFTGTYGRLDGRPVIGGKPDYRFSVQQSVNEGRCPEIHGAQIYLPFQCPQAKKVGTDYDLALKDEEYAKYWRMVAGYMAEFWNRYPAPLVALVRMKREALYLAQLFNRASGLGSRGLGVLIANTSAPERQSLIRGIRSGERAGYVTCGVGVESLDIPAIEVVHLVQRTKSINKIVQFVGRALRPHTKKRRALVVDYQVKKENIIQACSGLLLYAQGVGVAAETVRKTMNGGAIIALPDSGTPVPVPDSKTLGECEEWVIRECRLSTSSLVRKKEAILKYAATGAKRFTDKMEGRFEGCLFTDLAHVFYQARNPNSKVYDPEFIKRLKGIPGIHASWLYLRSEVMARRQQALIRRAEQGKPRPKWGSKNKAERSQAFSLANWTNPAKRSYKKLLSEKLRALRPDWFANSASLRLEDYVEQVPESQKSQEPETIPVAADWLQNRQFLDLYRMSSDKENVQAAIWRLAQTTRPFPLQRPNETSTSGYFIEDWREVYDRAPEELNGRTIKVPCVWPIAQLFEDAFEFTDPESSPPTSRKYQRFFSFHIKLRRQDWKCLRSCLPSRVESLMHLESVAGRATNNHAWDFYHGLSPWEGQVKARTLNLLRTAHQLPDDELVSMYERIRALDGELSRVWINGGYAEDLGIPKEAFDAIRFVESVVNHSPPEEETQPYTRPQRLVGTIYGILDRVLHNGKITPDQWRSVDIMIQSVLCGINRMDQVDGHLFGQEGLLRQALDLQPHIKRHRDYLSRRMTLILMDTELEHLLEERETGRVLAWFYRNNARVRNALLQLDRSLTSDKLLGIS
jgi:hypothetical protein